MNKASAGINKRSPLAPVHPTLFTTGVNKLWERERKEGKYIVLKLKIAVVFFFEFPQEFLLDSTKLHMDLCQTAVYLFNWMYSLVVN